MRMRKIIAELQSQWSVVFAQQKKRILEQYGSRFYHYGLEEWVFQWEITPKNCCCGISEQSLSKVLELKKCTLLLLQQELPCIMYQIRDRNSWNTSVAFQGLMKINMCGWINSPFATWSLFLPRMNRLWPVGCTGSYAHLMGGRLLKRWVMLPLKDISAIEERQEAVHYFPSPWNFPPSSQGTWNK